jgi:hypothetical protein
MTSTKIEICFNFFRLEFVDTTFESRCKCDWSKAEWFAREPNSPCAQSLDNFGKRKSKILILLLLNVIVSPLIEKISHAKWQFIFRWRFRPDLIQSITILKFGRMYIIKWFYVVFSWAVRFLFDALLSIPLPCLDVEMSVWNKQMESTTT